MDLKRRSARECAARVLDEVLGRGAYAQEALDRVARRMGEMPQRETALATEIAFGVIRHLRRLDWVLGRYVERAVKKEGVRNVLRVGAYELLCLRSTPPYAAVDEAVELAKRRYGARVAGFVNSVLRRLARDVDGGRIPRPQPSDPASRVALLHSYPDWMSSLFVRTYGPERATCVAAALNARPPLTLRVNRLRAARDEVADELRDAGLGCRPTRWSPVGLAVCGRVGDPARLAPFAAGRVTVQDEAAQLVSYAVAPRAGERVLDACSAPGGKATHLAELMGDEGEVVAADVSPARLRLVEQSARRLGLGSIRTVAADAATPSGGLRGFEPFDRVLVDAPCSGLGVIRRNPDIKWKRMPEDVETMARMQLALLEGCSSLLRQGGVMVYSVCTFTEEETTCVVERFLKRNPTFRLGTPPVSRYPFLAPFATERGFLIFDPLRHNIDGFFAAILTREG